MARASPRAVHRHEGGEPDPFRGPFFRIALVGADGVPEQTDVEVHLRRLRLYHRDRDPTGAIAAARDTPIDEFVVGSVLAHKTDTSQPDVSECSCRRTHLRWKVSWHGHGSEHDTWEPPSYLDKLPVFKAYNSEHRLGAHAYAQAKCERQHPARQL